jgi:DNA-binding transcriptional LysR family regulator
MSPTKPHPVDPFSFANRRLLPPFASLRAFEAVGVLGGIRRAATALNLDHAAVSRHVKSLEVWAGCPLIDRLHGGTLTEEGLRFHTRISAALNEIASASFDLTRRGGDTRLRLWCVPGLASEWLAPRLGVFSAHYPEIDLELHPTDGSPDFVRYEADTDIRYITDDHANQIAVSPDIQSVVIGRPPVIAVASAAFVETAHIGGAADLLKAPLIHESDFSQWRRWFAAHALEAAQLTGPKLWHGHLTLNAARLGQGVALTNTLLVGDDLKSGRLIDLTPAEPAVMLGSYHFRARRDQWQTPSVMSFRRWLQKNIEATMELTAAPGPAGVQMSPR